MSYTLNGTPLSDFGFIPGRAPGSNLAIEGCWDFPARMGKTYHDWDDGHGVEPYVEAEEMRFEGRNIRLHGYVKGLDRNDSVNKLNALYYFIEDFIGLVTLSCDWGDFSLYVREEIKAKYQGDGIIKLTIEFREPNPDLIQLIPPAGLIALYANNGADLSWSGDIEDEGYVIERSTDQITWEVIHTSDTNDTNYQDSYE